MSEKKTYFHRILTGALVIIAGWGLYALADQSVTSKGKIPSNHLY